MKPSDLIRLGFIVQKIETILEDLAADPDTGSPDADNGVALCQELKALITQAADAAAQPEGGKR